MLAALMLLAAAGQSPAQTPAFHCELVMPAPCTDATPQSPLDLPSCADFVFDTELEKAMQNGDRSARDLLEQRYDSTKSETERRRLAGMLLKRVSDDSRYWKDLLRLAEASVRFAGDEEALQAYCDEHGLDASGYATLISDALATVAPDPRAHDLLLRALETTE